MKPFLACAILFSASAPAFAQSPFPAAPLTLEDSIRIALSTHGQPSAARLQAEGADERITVARSSYYPQVTANANYDYFNQRRTLDNSSVGGIGGGFGSGGILSRSDGSVTTDIAVTQNLFDGGRTRQQVRAARARSQNAIGGFGNARSTLAFQVAQRFYEQLRQEKFVEQFRGQVALAGQQVEQVRAQIEAGTVARVDILGVQVTQRQAQFDLVTAQNNLATARVNFRNALGLERGPALQLVESPRVADITGMTGVLPSSQPMTPDDIASAPAVPPLDELPELGILNVAPPAVPQLAPLEEYLAQAQKLRPDLVQSRAAVRQSETALALAKIEKRPQVSASAGFNLDPRSRDDRRFVLGLGLSVPVFDGGARRAQVNASDDELQASRVILSQAEKDVAAEVEAAYTDITGQVERIANARVLVEQAQINLATATERYRLGLGIILDIVNAQTQLFNAQISATQAVYDYEIARAALDRAVGRFAWADPGEVPPEVAPVELKTVSNK